MKHLTKAKLRTPDQVYDSNAKLFCFVLLTHAFIIVCSVCVNVIIINILLLKKKKIILY